MLLFTASMHTRCKSFGALAHHRSAHCVVLRHLFATFSSLRENLPGALASKELGFLCDDDQVSLSEWVVVGVFGAERRAIVQERGRNTQHCAVNSVDEDRIAQCTSVMLTRNVDEMWLLQCRQQELLWHVMTSLSLVEDIMGHTQTRLIRLPSPTDHVLVCGGRLGRRVPTSGGVVVPRVPTSGGLAGPHAPTSGKCAMQFFSSPCVFLNTSPANVGSLHLGRIPNCSEVPDIDVCRRVPTSGRGVVPRVPTSGGRLRSRAPTCGLPHTNTTSGHQCPMPIFHMGASSPALSALNRLP